jgi:glycosyltransferase involved in cell wall biosynthesis
VKQKEVLIAIPMLLIGGTEMQTLNLARVLLSADYQTTVCCYYEFNNSMVSLMEATGAKVILMKLKRSDGMFSLMIKLRKLFKELKPDIVHVQYIAPGLLPVIAARLAKISTLFATVHQPGRVYNWKAKLLLRAAARLCTAFFCNSKSVEESWFGDSEVLAPDRIGSKRKHFTIYNGVDVAKIESILKETDTNKIRKSLNIGDKKVVGIVGRLRGEKGQGVLLSAMADVIKVFPDSGLIVVGDGPDRMSLELRAKSLGLESNILWLGQKDRNEVFQLYSIMDVVAVPSLFEGFGLSAAEAMAAGRPVVGSRVDGLTEIIEEGVTGYAVPVNNSGKMAGAIIEVLNNPEKAEAMGSQGHDRVKNMFSLERFADLTIAAYRHFTDSKLH